MDEKVYAIPSDMDEFIVIDDRGCWVWQRGKTPLGYGVTYDGHKAVYVHRRMYERLIGSIPEGLEPDHTCKNTSCCNPAHLEPVTHATNIRRSQSKLTPEMVRDIKSRFVGVVDERWKKVKETAKEFGVSPYNIHDILKGKRWADV